MGSLGYYSVIQFCPDPSRLEAANVGVVLFCPERKFLKAVVSSGNDRIRRFFGDQGFNWSHVNAAKQALVTRLEIEAERFARIEDLLVFVHSRGNAIVLSEPRSMRVEDPEADLKELFDDLVGGREKKKAVERRLELLDETFRGLQGQSKHVLFDQSYSVPVYEKTIKANYVYVNGVVNLLRVHSFESDRAAVSAVQLGGEGVLIEKHLFVDGKRAKQIVVSAQKSERETQAAEIFRDLGVDFYRQSDLETLVKKVEHEAH